MLSNNEEMLVYDLKEAFDHLARRLDVLPDGVFKIRALKNLRESRLWTIKGVYDMATPTEQDNSVTCKILMEASDREIENLSRTSFVCAKCMGLKPETCPSCIPERN